MTSIFFVIKKFSKPSFWWWVVLVAVMLGVAVIGGDVQKLIFADAEYRFVEFISCAKADKYYEIDFKADNTLITKYFNTKQVILDFLKDYEDGKNSKNKEKIVNDCGLGEPKIPPIGQQLTDLYQSVVRIKPNPKDQGGGSGFYLGSGTYTQTKEKVHFILTNAHVYDGIRRRGVVQTFEQTSSGLRVRRNFPFSGCHCVNQGKDLALIAVKAENMELEPLPIAKAPPKIGEKNIWHYSCAFAGLPSLFPSSCFLERISVDGVGALDPSGRIYGRNAKGYVFGSKVVSRAAEGRSGGPILRSNPESGRLEVISILHASDHRSPGFTGISLEDIREFLEKDCGVGYLLE